MKSLYFLTFMYMITMSIITMIYSLIMFNVNIQIIMEWNIMLMNSMNFEFIMILDWISLIFSSTVMFISSMIMIYSSSYMNSSLLNKKFIYLMIMFIMSMILMIISPNIMSIMLGWDGLGLTSFCLIIFFQNWSSFNSGMITIITNRIGDISIILTISLTMMYGSGNLFMLNLNNNWISYFLITSAMTKSAQFPFSSWLPAAMAAPTPVSSLVHSSTLVTAGVYILIRYNNLLDINNTNTKILLLCSSFTMFMSSISAMFEYDLKKIIALSTLSQLGLMMSMLTLNMKYLALFHLLTHAMFKSMLFMCSGMIIHNSFNNQDIRQLGMLNYSNPFISSALMIASLSLSGWPFTAGFYSKDLIMESLLMSKMNMMSMFMLFSASIFTIMYSMRLCMYTFLNNMNCIPTMNNNENLTMNMSIIPLIIMSIIFGSLMNWLFFMNYSTPIHLPLKLKTLMMIITLLSMIMFFFIKLINNMNFMFMNHMFKSMWFLNNITKNSSPMILLMSEKLTFNMEKKWMENLVSLNMMNNMKYFFKLNYLNKANFIYNIKLFIMIMLIFMMII